eukprot:tig00020553_g10660.t1
MMQLHARGTECNVCRAGFFCRRSRRTLTEAGATACKGCEEAQLCPLATSQPIDPSFFRSLVGQAALDLGGLRAGSRLRALWGARRGLLGAAAAEVAPPAAQEEVTLPTEEVVYDTNAANVSRAAIRTEQAALQRLYRIGGGLAGAVGGLLLLAGLAAACYIRRGLPVRPRWRPAQGTAAADAEAREARRLERRTTLAKLDLLFTEDVAEAKRPLAERVAARRAQRAAEAERAAPAGGGPPDPGRTWRSSARGPWAPEESPKSVAGAVATLVAIGLALLAAAFVILQFAIANYEVVQTLLPGTSPSAGAIAGPVEVSASFLGWSAARACVVRREAAVNSSGSLGAANATEEGAVVTWRNIVPVGGSPPPAATAAYDASQRACLVTWRCELCRVASTADAAVDFRRVARLARAFALRYSVRVPAYAAISGAVTTHAGASGRLTVFRGTRPVTVPVLLTPLHFENEADGRPQYDAALQQADNRPSELDETSFGLCSLTRQLSEPECAVEAVGFRAALGVNDVYLLRAGDALADVASLAGTALALGGQLVVSYYAALSAYAMRREILERATATKAARSGSLAAGAGLQADSEASRPAASRTPLPAAAPPIRRARAASMVETGHHAPPSGPEPPPVRRARTASMVEIALAAQAALSRPPGPPSEQLTPHGIRQGRSNSLPLLLPRAAARVSPRARAASRQRHPRAVQAAVDRRSRGRGGGAGGGRRPGARAAPRSGAALPAAGSSRRHSVVQAVVIDDRRAEPDLGRPQPPRSLPLLSPLWAGAEGPAPPAAGTPGEDAEAAPPAVQTSTPAKGH